MSVQQREQNAQPESGGFDNPYRLTQRELKLCRLLLDGVPRQQMAPLLHLSPALVRSTLGRVIRKTGARNSAHLLHIVATLRPSPVESVCIEDLSERFEPAPLDPYAYQSVVFA